MELSAASYHRFFCILCNVVVDVDYDERRVLEGGGVVHCTRCGYHGVTTEQHAIKLHSTDLYGDKTAPRRNRTVKSSRNSNQHRGRTSLA